MNVIVSYIFSERHFMARGARLLRTRLLSAREENNVICFLQIFTISKIMEILPITYAPRFQFENNHTDDNARAVRVLAQCECVRDPHAHPTSL